LQDLLQYYRGSLIGTPDLIRDARLTNPREALGALKALHVLGFAEIGKLDPQTIAWRWVAGRGQSRTYQRGYFRREEAPVSFDDGPRDEQGNVRWPWIDAIVHREWLLKEQADGFAAVADNDGTRRYRPPTADGQMVLNLIDEDMRAMPALQRAVLELTLLRECGGRETADLLGISLSTVRRLSERGLDALRKTLTEEGFAPSTLKTEPGHSSEVAQAA
jgi:hypothetical protein